MSLSEEIEARIKAWIPDGVNPRRAPDWVDFVRATVRAARPRHHSEARDALRYGADFVAAASAAGLELDAATLFSSENVASYIDALARPAGSKQAIASILKRLHPDVGLQGTTRRPAALTVPAGTNQKNETVPVRTGLPPAVEATIATFVPSLLPNHLWVPVAELVRTAVTAAAPASTARAEALVRDVGYLAAWAASNHRMLTIDVVLNPATIEGFLTVLLANGRHESSVATFASNLHAVRDANGIRLGAVIRRRFTPPTAKTPYREDEVDLFFEQADRVRNHTRREPLLAALHLMFGVGAHPGEVAQVAPEAVRPVDGGAVVDLPDPPRSVPVAPAHVTGLLHAARLASARRERYLIGGTSDERGRRLHQLLRGKNSWRVDVDSSRARSTWLVQAASTPEMFATALEFYVATGFRSAERLTELFNDLVDQQRGAIGSILQVEAEVGGEPVEDADADALDDEGAA